MSRIGDWLSRWWGEDDRQISINEYLELPARYPHWTAKPFRALAKQLQASGDLPWFQRPVGLTVLAVIASLLTAAVTKYLGLM